MRINERTSVGIEPKARLDDHRPRRGVTLVEVLIAVFLLAIGLMGVLALFPVGALQMAQAVKDERTAQLASTMEVRLKLHWRLDWLDDKGQLRSEYDLFARNPEILALDDPNNTPTTTQALSDYMNDPVRPYPGQLSSNRASWPVLIDPIGYANQTGTAKTWVGDGTMQIVPRRSLTIGLDQNVTGAPSSGVTVPPTYINTTTGSMQVHSPPFGAQVAPRIKLCGLLDDLTFGDNGLPPGGTVQRAGMYNAAWLIQRPKNNVRTEINLQVVVYFKRPPDSNAAETIIGSGTFQSSLGDKSFLLNLSGGVPVPKAGTWILAASRSNGTNIDAFADFYRIVSITLVSGNQYRVEVAQSVRKRHMQYDANTAYTATIVQMEYVAEVFDKGTVSLFDQPTQ